MLCQKCHKNLATVRYAEVVDGQVTDIHLCQQCLKRQQDNLTGGFELSGPAPTPRRRVAAAPAIMDALSAQRSCASCGIRLKDILKTGVVGCPQCYDHFSEQLEPVLRSLHTSLRHRGKSPHTHGEDERRRISLQSKRSLLRSALKMENYEEAAVLRDEIQELETALEITSKE